MEEKIDFNSISINPNIILFKRDVANNLETSEYKKNYKNDNNNDFIKLHLNESDEILSIHNNKQFMVTDRLLDIQRYIHNVLNISYKNVIDIEIIYTINNNIENEIYTSRYPCQSQPALDFKSTILDTIDKCILNISNISKMYFFVLISSIEQREINELINRYLFIDNHDHSRQNVNLSFYRNDNILWGGRDIFNINNQILNQEFEIQLGNYINTPPYNNNQHIEYFSQLDGNLNNIGFYENRNMGENINNFMGLLSYIINPGSLEESLEPVRVTINESKINLFLSNFSFEVDNKILKIKNQTTCPICISKYKKNDSVSFINNCEHLFHSECINKWICEFSHKCPVCRLSADPSKNT